MAGGLGAARNLSALGRYFDYLLRSKAESIAEANAYAPQGVSKAAADINTRLDSLISQHLGKKYGLTRFQKNNVARAVDELGLDTLGFHGRREIPEKVSKTDWRDFSPSHGFSQHVDLTPKGEIANYFAAGNGTNIPVLIKAGDSYIVSDQLANNPTALVDTLIGRKWLPEKRIYAKDPEAIILPEDALAAFREEGNHASIIYPNYAEGPSAIYGRLQNLRMGNEVFDPGTVVFNPSAVPLNAEKFRFALETEGKPGIGYRKATGGLISLKGNKRATKQFAEESQ